jgi:predicted transcriptional regulator
MGGMMGGTNSQVSTQHPALSYVGILFLVFAAVAIVGVGGLVYFIMFPEIRSITPVKQNDDVLKSSDETLNNSYSAVYKTLKPEEKKVLDVLAANDGKYLQKYLRKDAGLSRLKVHRILSRLAERGMVTLQKSGNTNEVILADWLKPK